MRDPYLYPGTEVLKNLANIKDRNRFDEMLSDHTSNRILELSKNPIQGNFDFAHFCKVHEHIFQDVFEWAGSPRIIDIEKSEEALGGLSVEYERHEDIIKSATQVLAQMKSRPWNDFTIDEKAKIFSSDMAALWKVHSFREGNTRTTLVFCCDFAESQKMPLDRSLFQQHAAYTRRALVAANFGDLSKPEFLIKIVKDSMERGIEQQKTLSVEKQPLSTSDNSDKKQAPQKEKAPKKPNSPTKPKKKRDRER